MDNFLLIGIGASAGGFTPLSTLVKRMPRNLDAAVFLVMHLSLPNPLAACLNSPGGLPIRDAIDLDRFEPGNGYVCPPDRYLSVENGILRVEQSPKESVHRPSVNALFRSGALNYGRRMVGVLLSGAMNDGSAGLWQIKKHGGVTIVQDPAEAKYPDMPQNAIKHVGVDFVLPVERIADKLIELSASNRASAREGVRVLIVEDEALVAKNLHAGLQSFGYDVVGIAETGETALAVATRTSPELVLMDIGLPGSISGVEAARAIWDRLQIPVVYLTAYTDLETLNAVKTTENYGYVAKPVYMEAVRAAVELALSRREKERRIGFS